MQAANGNGFSALDVAVERNAVFATEGAVTRAAIDTATTRARLGQLLGIAGWRDDWQLRASLPPLPLADPDPAALEAAMLSRRFDVLAATEAVAGRLRVLSTQRRFRWLGSLELGVFQDRAIGGTPFVGPNAVVEIPLFDQRQAQLLSADAQWRTAMRQLEATRLAARTELRIHLSEMQATRALLEQYARSILPNQHQIVAQLGTASDPGRPDRLRLRQAMLSAEEEQVGLLRDYWRARSALALAAGQWSGLNGLQPTENRP